MYHSVNAIQLIVLRFFDNNNVHVRYIRDILDHEHIQRVLDTLPICSIDYRQLESCVKLFFF